MPADRPRLPGMPGDRRRSPGRARRGLNETVLALRGLGRLEPIDGAIVALCRVAADELDDACADLGESRYTRGVLIARYHSVLTHLLARPDVELDPDALERLFAAMDDPPQS